MTFVRIAMAAFLVILINPVVRADGEYVGVSWDWTLELGDWSINDRACSHVEDCPQHVLVSPITGNVAGCGLDELGQCAAGYCYFCEGSGNSHQLCVESEGNTCSGKPGAGYTSCGR